MKRLETFKFAIASGKGGTGKTLTATGIASLLAESGKTTVLIDCDVEAPNDHLFLPTVYSETIPVEVPFARIDTEKCTVCGTCRELCAFGAPRIFGPMAVVFDEMCHGCGLCVAYCPTSAMQEVIQRIGEVHIGTSSVSDALTLVTGYLDVGQVKTPAIIHAARKMGEALNADFVLFDSPPGVACAAVAATKAADAVLLVAEPTLFGLHDLELSLRLCKELGVPAGILLNRYTGSIPDGMNTLMRKFGVTLVGKIPFDRRIAEAYACGNLAHTLIPELSDILTGACDALKKLAESKSHDSVLSAQEMSES